MTKAQIYEDEGQYAKATLLRADSSRSDQYFDESDGISGHNLVYSAEN